MIETMNRADFIEEVTPQVEKIIMTEYRNVDSEKVLKSLYQVTGGDIDECTHTTICEVIEDLGAEPYDPDMDSADWDDDEEDEGDGVDYDDEDY